MYAWAHAAPENSPIAVEKRLVSSLRTQNTEPAGLSRYATHITPVISSSNPHRHSREIPWGGAVCILLASITTACASVPAASREQPLRVMTYNIQYGHEGIDSVIAVIRAEKPDIVGLQEVDVHWDQRSNFVNQAELLAKGTGMEYRFARIYQLPNTDSSKPPREFGVGILSRYPVTSFTNHSITRLSTQDANPVPAPLPGFLEAMVDVHGMKVRVFDVHLDYRRDPAVRERQVAEMLGYIGDSEVPTLLMGDLNATPDAPELQPLFRKMHDTWPYSQGPGLTDPVTKPHGKIDYVMTSGNFRVRKAWVPTVYASDHFPVVVDLVVEKELR
jgi:endonuclease/exonuclease/phosphatase family metal-dependent hydrolase